MLQNSQNVFSFVMQNLEENLFLAQVSDDEVAFLTNGDPENEDAVLSLWFEGLKLLIVTDGEKGCRYYTKVFLFFLFFFFLVNCFFFQ